MRCIARNGERMTQRNGVSKEGARGASDKPHNALARYALLNLCTRQSRRGYAVLVCGSLGAFVACHDCRERDREEKEAASAAKPTENLAIIPRSENAPWVCLETCSLCYLENSIIFFIEYSIIFSITLIFLMTYNLLFFKNTMYQCARDLFHFFVFD